MRSTHRITTTRRKRRNRGGGNAAYFLSTACIVCLAFILVISIIKEQSKNADYNESSSKIASNERATRVATLDRAPSRIQEQKSIRIEYKTNAIPPNQEPEKNIGPQTLQANVLPSEPVVALEPEKAAPKIDDTNDYTEAVNEKKVSAGKDGNFVIRKESISLSGKMQGRRNIVAQVAIKLREKELTPCEASDDIVLVMPYPTEINALEQHLEDLCEKHGITLISINFCASIDKDQKTVEGDYYFPNSGSAELWKEALNKVRSKYKLKANKVITCGLSGGGSAAHLFAESFPELVEAYAIEAGKNFTLSPKFTGPILISRGEYDYVRVTSEPFEISAMRLFEKGETEYKPAIITYRPEWGSRENGVTIFQHCGPWVVKGLSAQWIADLFQMRQKNNGVLKHYASWGNKSKKWDGTCFPSDATLKMAEGLPASISSTAEEVSFIDPGNKGALVFFDKSDDMFVKVSGKSAPFVTRRLRLLVQQAADTHFNSLGVDIGVQAKNIQRLLSDFLRGKKNAIARAVVYKSNIDSETLKLLKKNGCREIYYIDIPDSDNGKVRSTAEKLGLVTKFISTSTEEPMISTVAHVPPGPSADVTESRVAKLVFTGIPNE